LINPAPFYGVLEPGGRISLIPILSRSKLRGILRRCGINIVETENDDAYMEVKQE
jgi:hypothetical protein